MIIPGCQQTAVTNRCDCEQDCYDSDPASESELGDCLATCDDPASTCADSCNNDFSDASDSANADLTDCNQACQDDLDACLSGCDGEDPGSCNAACANDKCICDDECQLTYWAAIRAPTHDQISCLSECCTKDGGTTIKDENLTFASCKVDCNTALVDALNDAQKTLYETLEGFPCFIEDGGDDTSGQDALNAQTIADITAQYTNLECLYQCNLDNTQAQKVCGGLSSCFLDCIKIFDAADIECTSESIDGASADDTQVCRDTNLKDYWDCIKPCCFELHGGGDPVTVCVLECQKTNLDCLEGEDTSSCNDDLTACLKECYQWPKVKPCSQCDLIFVNPPTFG